MSFMGKEYDAKVWVSRTVDGNTWSAGATVPDAYTPVGPAMAVFRGRLYLAWHANDSNHVWWTSTEDTFEWSKPMEQSDLGTLCHPALATVIDADGTETLYMAWRGADLDERIYWSSTTDGSTWAKQQCIPGATEATTTTRAPALVAFKGSLYAAWHGGKPELLKASDEAIRLARFDGKSWSTPTLVPNAVSTDGPAMTVFKDNLYVAWKGRSTGKLLPPSDLTLYATRTADGSTWDTITQPKSATSPDSPALVAYNNQLYLAWKATADSQLWYAKFDGGATWSTPVVIKDAGTGDVPALCTAKLGPAETLCATWRGSWL